jgi:hypothetical protein
MEHKPCRFLGNTKVFSELSAGNTLFVCGDKPNRHHPLAHTDLAVLEDRSNLDRKTLPAIAAFVSPAIGKMIDLSATTKGAERASFPAN